MCGDQLVAAEAISPASARCADGPWRNNGPLALAASRRSPPCSGSTRATTWLRRYCPRGAIGLLLGKNELRDGGLAPRESSGDDRHSGKAKRFTSPARPMARVSRQSTRRRSPEPDRPFQSGDQQPGAAGAPAPHRSRNGCPTMRRAQAVRLPVTSRKTTAITASRSNM
jgi:hypothetical protein